MRQGLLLLGFTEDSVQLLLRAHKVGSTRQYQGIWTKFLAFLSMRQLSEMDISVAVVCDFLSYQSVTCGRKYRTISGYRSALRHPLLFAFNVEVNCVVSDLFLRGVFNFLPPVKSRMMPRWSLNMLLQFLRCPLFEPLETCSFSRLSQKTLCLLLLASGRRISDIANLSRTSFISSSEDLFVLDWVPGYVPKNHSAAFKTPPPSVRRLQSSVPDDLLLCPVRCLLVYLERTRELLDEVPLSLRHPCLWIKPRTVVQWSKASLTKCFVNVVRDSRIYNDLAVPAEIGPHQMRKFSASYAALVGQPETLVCKVMGFSSKKIFRKNYVAWVPPLLVSCVLPGGTFLAVNCNDDSDDNMVSD